MSFQSDEHVFSATYSERWGVVATSGEGLLRLEESDLTWHPLGPSLSARHVVAAADGKLWVTDQQKRLLLYTPLGASSSEPVAELELELFPNPAGSHFILKGFDPGQRYEIRDLLGRRLLEIRPMGSETMVSIADLANGLYYIHSIQPHQAGGRLFVVAR